MTAAKTTGTTTIEVSITTYNKIHSVAEKIAQIVHKKKISIDQTLKIMFATQPLDYILTEMTNEETKY
jgi:hypothetical protein